LVTPITGWCTPAAKTAFQRCITSMNCRTPTRKAARAGVLMVRRRGYRQCRARSHERHSQAWAVCW
jgi:hypothetical protein